jgi:hypothetical protein
VVHTRVASVCTLLPGFNESDMNAYIIGLVPCIGYMDTEIDVHKL